MSKKSNYNPRSITSRKHHFSAPYGSKSSKQSSADFINPAIAGSLAAQYSQSNFVNFVESISDMTRYNRDELLEHLYVMEPEIATSIDASSLMVRKAFKCFSLVNDSEMDNMPNSLYVDDDTTITFNKAKKALASEMVDVANKLGTELYISDMLEAWASILQIHGNLFLWIRSNLSITVLPNDRVTIIDHPDRIHNPAMNQIGYDNLITEANYLVLDEQLPSQKILSKDEFVIIRLRDTPIYVEDCKGRNTYGIYAVSPLRRAVIPVWYRRVLMANDAMWRYKAMPKLDCSIQGESFSTGQYVGTPEVRMQKAVSDATNTVEMQKSALENTAPDAAFVHLDTTTLQYVEPKNANFVQANELLDQTTESIFSAINMPVSIIKGQSTSNYAGELAIYSYASLKIEQMTTKLSRVILKVIKERLSLINSQYPVEWLECTISYDMSSNTIDNHKNAIMKKELGECTSAEIRAEIGLKPLTEEQRKDIVKPTPLQSKSMDQAMARESLGSDKGETDGISTNSTTKSPKYPTTRHSANTQPTDVGDAAAREPLKRINQG